MMLFLKQIRYEIRNILKSKFLLITSALIILLGAAVPILGLLSNRQGGNIEPTFIVEDFEARDGLAPDIDREGMESITVNGVTIYADNPFYWNIQSLLNEKQAMSQGGDFKFENPASVDLMLELIDLEIDYFLMFAQSITTYQDYRQELAWQGVESLYDKFFLGNSDNDIKVLVEVAQFRRGYDAEMIRTKYVNLSAVERLAAIDRADGQLEMLADIVLDNDFPKYIALRIDMARDEIVDIEANIAIQEQAIIDNPSQEDNLSQYIEQLRKQIDLIETNTIPLLEYRLEKNIIPGQDIWQNRAISDIENSRNQLSYMVIMTEEEWNNSRGGGGGPVFKEFTEYRSYDSYYYPNGQDTYEEYVASMQRQIDALNKTIIIAQKSLDSGQPDMLYVPNGSRSRTAAYLRYSMIVALFGVLLGGWLIASEYQQGTIRLLMIRPKTRTKILLAKFGAALGVWLAVALASTLVNAISNGLCYGFSDFAYPNYTAGGQIGFLGYFIPALMACLVPILFTFCIAFMLSVIVRNTAVAIAIPVVLYIASIIAMSILAYQSNSSWLFWTPIPFMQMAELFIRQSSFQYLIQNGATISIGYGVGLMLVLSAGFVLTSLVIFKKRDITN